MSSHGFCYAVVFTNDSIKFGGSSSVATRVNAHVKQAQAFGVYVDCIYFTDAIDDWRLSEKQLLSGAKIKLGDPFAGSEYFRGNREDAKGLMMSLGVWVNRVKTIKSNQKQMGFSCAIVPYADSLIEARGVDFMTVPESSRDHGAFAVEEKHDRRKKRLEDIDLSRKIKTYLGSSGELTAAVIHCRQKSLPRHMVNEQISSMVASGEIIEIKHTHPRNKICVTKYALPEQ